MSHTRQEFLKLLEQERKARQQSLIENPARERNRLKWIKFQNTIMTVWLPIMEEYLQVIGKLWFGDELRLSGPMFHKHEVSVPSYVVSHNIYGPMAIFCVEKKDWNEREKAFSSAEGNIAPKIEQFKAGYRCRVTMNDDGQYEMENANRDILIRYNNGLSVDEKDLLEIFVEVFLDGPQVVHARWKDPFTNK